MEPAEAGALDGEINDGSGSVRRVGEVVQPCYLGLERGGVGDHAPDLVLEGGDVVGVPEALHEKRVTVPDPVEIDERGMQVGRDPSDSPGDRDVDTEHGGGTRPRAKRMPVRCGAVSDPVYQPEDDEHQNDQADQRAEGTEEGEDTADDELHYFQDEQQRHQAEHYLQERLDLDVTAIVEHIRRIRTHP